MWGHIKYKLLCWLLGDICRRTENCDRCKFNRGGCKIEECTQSDAYGQGLTVWLLQEGE